MKHLPVIRLLLAACLAGLPLTASAGKQAEPPLPGTPFSGGIKASLYAIEPALYAKAPAALLADPAKLLAFFQRSEKDGRIQRILVGEVRVQHGEGEFKAEGADKMVFGGLLRLGFFIKMPTVSEDGDIVRLRHDFAWRPDFKVRGGRDDAATRGGICMVALRSKADAQLTKGGTVMAAEWRSDIQPPGAKSKPDTPWHYLLFYSLP